MFVESNLEWKISVPAHIVVIILRVITTFPETTKRQRWENLWFSIWPNKTAKVEQLNLLRRIGFIDSWKLISFIYGRSSWNKIFDYGQRFSSYVNLKWRARSNICIKVCVKSVWAKDGWLQTLVRDEDSLWGHFCFRTTALPYCESCNLPQLRYLLHVFMILWRIWS